ncbi:proton-conducting transporter membrane subunit [Solwaraspora sp. WMMD1047]|uniref:proton-conducting transporter transmembrane domain-containing protein n=1 Tax=Solwaraspora sp. WMMD1047 TaxID=3016102 RepID=UPI002417D364|nr:proton-conducting transporter membrane subunit [Solwaraspora sp. WMMD1047]MDG4832160.1 proton-conducting transporter membrane subunit [Solwaraspora sp. WMMD1047]
MSLLLVLPVVGPLLAAGVLLATPYRIGVHRAAGLATTTGVLAVAAGLLAVTYPGGIPVVRIGGWPGVIAISFVADTLAALMVAVTAVVVLVCLVCAIGGEEERRAQYVPLVLVMSAGGYGAFLAGDLFNLFVMIEMMLVPSYALMSLGGSPGRVRAARVYLTVNLLGSTILLAGVGLLYGLTGEVRLAALAGAARTSPGVALAGGVILLALAVKAAVVPLHGWLPRSYPHAPPAMAALFSGLLTKVGLYAIIRIFAVLYDGDPRFRWIIAAAALASMVVGVLAAVGEATVRSILSFHMVSQIGYVLLGLAVFTAAGLAGAVFYLVQYIVVKTALFLCAGALCAGYGTDRLDRLGGLTSRQPLLAVAFLGAALSLAGLPPFSGFLAKFLIMRATALDRDYLGLTVAVVVSLVTLVSMLKIWKAVFWDGEPAPDHGGVGPDRGGAGSALAVRLRPTRTVPVLALAVLTLALGIGAAPLLALADAAAAGLLDPADYVRAVLG